MLRRSGRLAAYGLGGFVGTAGIALLLLNLTQSVQPVIYDAVYLPLGPSEATKAAILGHVLAVAIVGISGSLFIGDYLSDRLANRQALAGGVAVMIGGLLAFLAVALAGVGTFLTAVIILTIAFISVPVLLRYRYGIRSGGLAAVAGGIPVVLLLLLAAGFGLGWGWGYVVTAEEVPADAVNGTAATFDDAPAFEQDLFAPANCETDADGRQVCYLSLRGYDHEPVAAQFMARHGVRCPYQSGPADPDDAFVARHEGTLFRITCTPHGD